MMNMLSIIIFIVVLGSGRLLLHLHYTMKGYDINTMVKKNETVARHEQGK